MFYNTITRKKQGIHFNFFIVVSLLHSSEHSIVYAVPNAGKVSSSSSSRYHRRRHYHHHFHSHRNETGAHDNIKANSNNPSFDEDEHDRQQEDIYERINVINDDYNALNDNLVFNDEKQNNSIFPKTLHFEDDIHQPYDSDNRSTINPYLPRSLTHLRSSGISSSPSSTTMELSPKKKKISPDIIRTQSIRAIANSIIHDASQTVSKVLRGDVAGHVPVHIYGQTLDEEVSECYTIHHGQNNHRIPSSSTPINTFGGLQQNQDDNTDIDVGDSISSNDDNEEESILTKRNDDNNNITYRQKLYGGAQYHRLLQSYHDLILTKPISQISPEEVSLLIHGISDTNHDGSDLLRSVAIISSKHMDVLAGSLLKSLAQRIEFVFHRMWKVVEYTMTTRTLGIDKASKKYGRDIINDGLLSVDSVQEIEHDMMLFVKEKYYEFVKEKVTFAYRLASGDIDALMKFVSWDIAFANGSMGTTSRLSSSSPSPIVSQQGDVDDMDLFIDDYDDEEEVGTGGNNDEDLGDSVGGVLNEGKGASYVALTKNPKDDGTSIDPETEELLMKIMHAVRNATPIITSTGRTETQTFAAVNTLVQHVTNQWRLEIARLISTKFNAFCLVAFHEEFGTFLRKEINEYIQKQFDMIINTNF